MAINIHPIQMGLVTVYAIKADGVILIDGGGPHKLANFKRGIEEAGIRPEEVQLIILTHGHWDHTGSTRDIQELTGAMALMHQADVHLLVPSNPSQPPGLTAWGKIISFISKFYTPLIHLPLFQVDIVSGGEEISLAEYGIPGMVIPTPGHTWGSVSVLLDSGEAFVGDLAMNAFPLRLSPGLPIFGDDMQVIIESWRKLLPRGVKTVYPAHGRPFPVEVMRKAIA